MQIRDIIIDGFGCFADKHITGLKAGINVIYGDNESGKTTLLEFVRRILFGFPTGREAKNPYPALKGGAYGGKLICELSDGKPLIIARTKGSRGVKLTIRANNANEWDDQKKLGEFLGHASETLYENVYAFTLDELQDVASLKEDEVQNRIYGAGLGNLPLTKIEKEFDDQYGDIFKPTGSKQKIRELQKEIKSFQIEVREVQKGLKRYDERVKTLEKLKAEKTRVDAQFKKKEEVKGMLGKRRDLYGDYVELVGIEEDLAGMEMVGDEFPENGMSSLSALKGEVKNIEDRLAEETGDYENISRQLKDIHLNEELLGYAAEVASLQQSIRQVEEALRDQIAEEENKARLDQQIRVNLERIGGGWDEEAVRRFTLTSMEEDKMQSLRQVINSAKENVNNARAKLEMYRERRAEEMAKGFQAPKILQWGSVGLAVLGFAGFFYGMSAQDFVLEIIFALIIFLGVIFSILVFKGKGRKDKGDPAEVAYSEKLKKAETELADSWKAWRDWMRSKNLDGGLRPEAIDKVLRNIQKVQTDLKEKKNLEQRLALMQRTVASAEKTVDRVKPSVKHLNLAQDVVANIKVIQHCFEEARKNAEEKAHLQKQAANHKSKKEQLENQLEKKKIEVREFLQVAGAVDENDFLRKNETIIRR
ncbi:MAG: AAA family ATPase, partial [Nitrospinales bacterium]